MGNNPASSAERRQWRSRRWARRCLTAGASPRGARGASSARDCNQKRECVYQAELDLPHAGVDPRPDLSTLHAGVAAALPALRIAAGEVGLFDADECECGERAGPDGGKADDEEVTANAVMHHGSERFFTTKRHKNRFVHAKKRLYRRLLLAATSQQRQIHRSKRLWSKSRLGRKKRGSSGAVSSSCCSAGLASVIVIFLAGHLKDHPFWKSGVEHFGTAILIAAFLGLTIHIWLEKQLTEDVFAAAMGYELPDE